MNNTTGDHRKRRIRRCRIQLCLQRHPFYLPALVLLLANYHVFNCYGPNNHHQFAVAFGMIAIPSLNMKVSHYIASSSSTLASSSRTVVGDEPSSSTLSRQRQQQPTNRGKRKKTLTPPQSQSTSQGMTNEVSQTHTTTSTTTTTAKYMTEKPTPWNADYATSLRTQHRIQKVAAQAEAIMLWNNHNRNNNIHRRHHHHHNEKYSIPHDDSDNYYDANTTGRNITNNASLAKQAICTILQTLHDTPPEFCNAANLVCAMTLSSKIWERSKADQGKARSSSSSSSRSTFSSSLSTTTNTTTTTTTATAATTSNNQTYASHFEINKLYSALFTQTLTTLFDLVSIPNQLSPRQLCNAAWSLAKFILHDDGDDYETSFAKNVNTKMLGRRHSSRTTATAATSTPTTSTTTTTRWNLREEYDWNGTMQTMLDDGAVTMATTSSASFTSSRSMDGLIDEIFNLIAQRVIDHLEEIQRSEIIDDLRDDDDIHNRGNITQSTKLPPHSSSAPTQHTTTNIIRPGEISMLLWAYAIVGPRDRPPGWESPRRVERLSSVVSSDGDLSDGVAIQSSTGHYSGVDVRKNTVGSVATAVEKDADFVTFVELDSFSTSSDECYEKKECNYADALIRSSPDSSGNTVDRLFDAVATAFCRGEGVKMVATEMVEKDHTSLLSKCTWRELSNIAWSYATRGAYKSKDSESVMSFIANEATSRIRSCTFGDAAAAASVATTGARENNSCNFLPRDAIQIAWALGTMESDNVNSGDALVYLVDSIHDYWIDNGDVSPAKKGSKQQQQQRQRRPLAHWTCADLVQLATAMAHGRLDNQSVLEAVFRESLERISGDNVGGRRGGQHPRYSKGFSTAEISILIWVQARLYLTPKFGDLYSIFPSAASQELLRRMGKNDMQLPKRMRQIGLGPQEQANLAWSLTVLEIYSDSGVTLLQNIFHAASSLFSWSSPSSKFVERVMQLEHAHQLWQSIFLLSTDCPYATKFVPLEFRNYLEEKWKQEKSRSKQSSSRHRAISQTLNLMKVAHRNEYDEDVDVAIVLDESSAWTHTAQNNFDGLLEEGHRKVAVEFDGPHHFTRAASTMKGLLMIDSGTKITPRVLGHTVLKYRLLKRKGWTVIRIPYYEFDKIPFWASMERQRYLQRALKTHEKIEFSEIDVSEYKAMPSTRHSRFD